MSHGSASLKIPTLTGIGAPAITPRYVGQDYIDTSTGSVYKAVGTDGYWNWAYVGGGPANLAEFNKNTVPGLLFWYDANDVSSIVKDGGNAISNIYDKSGNGYHLAPITANQKPIWTENIQNGLPAIYFNPTGSTATGMTRGNLSISAQPITHFYVIKPVRLNYGADQLISEGQASGRNLFQINATDNKFEIYAGAIVTTAAVSTSSATIATVIFNSSSSSLQINNISAITGLNPSTGGLYGPTFGADYNNNASYSGYICEILCYSGVISPQNQIIIRSYLNTIWGVY
jgi:hypothetical protein